MLRPVYIVPRSRSGRGNGSIRMRPDSRSMPQANPSHESFGPASQQSRTAGAAELFRHKTLQECTGPSAFTESMLRIERKEWPSHESAGKVMDFAASATPGRAGSGVPTPVIFPLPSTSAITLAWATPLGAIGAARSRSASNLASPRAAFVNSRRVSLESANSKLGRWRSSRETRDRTPANFDLTAS
jgi:hypothetical protein